MINILTHQEEKNIWKAWIEGKEEQTRCYAETELNAYKEVIQQSFPKNNSKCKFLVHYAYYKGHSGIPRFDWGWALDVDSLIFMIKKIKDSHRKIEFKGIYHIVLSEDILYGSDGTLKDPHNMVTL